jgi:hypothetical protein
MPKVHISAMNTIILNKYKNVNNTILNYDYEIYGSKNDGKIMK